MRVLPLALRIAVSALLFATCFVVSSPAAEAQTLTRDYGREAAFVANLNAQRAARGLSPLIADSSMSASAASWTRQMVGGSFLAHSTNLRGGVTGSWSKVGENVGRGRTVNSLTGAFMASPSHARNVLDASYTHVGVAVYVHPNGRVYTTHRFAAIRGTVRRAPQTVVVPPQPARPAQVRTVTVPAAPPAPQAVSGPAAQQPAASEPDALAKQRAAEHDATMRLMAETFGTNWTPAN